jgi:prefoldin subunit 5
VFDCVLSGVFPVFTKESQTMASQTTSKKHAKLKQLARQTQQNIFDMLRIVDEILQDREYVDQHGGEGPLLDSFENHEFSHFGGTPALSAMLRAYRHNPKKAIWQEHAFNLRVMIDLATPEKDRGEVQRINWKSRCAELEEEVKRLNIMLEEYRATANDLRQRCDELTGANGELRGELKATRRRRELVEA